MWTIKSDERLELYIEQELIAVLQWSERDLLWELYYKNNQYLINIDVMEGFGKLDIEPVERAAVESIIDYCKELSDIWQEKAEDMEAIL